MGTTCDFWNMKCNKLVYGVLFRKLSDVIEDYDNAPDIQIHYGKALNNPFDYEWPLNNLKDQEQQFYTSRFRPETNLEYYQTCLTKSFIKYRELPYAYGCCGINMCAVICKLCRPLRFLVTCGRTETSVVCSELVAMVWRDSGLLPEDINTADVSPMDFLNYETDRHGVPLAVTQMPTVLFTAYGNNNNNNNNQTTSFSAISNQPKIDRIQSQRYQELGNLEADQISVHVDKMNLGTGDEDLKSIKSQTQKTLRKIYYGEEMKENYEN